MDLDDYITLAKSMDYPLSTNELLKSNDFYGHATILKKYSGHDNQYQIKGVIRHGMGLGKTVWDNEKNADLPCIFAFSNNTFERENYGNKEKFSIGPYIYYANKSLSDEDFIKIKNRNGKTLLVFPQHSTHWIDVSYDHKHFISVIKNLSVEYDTVLVCLYWKDILNKKYKLYEKHGFRCTTAGHMYDNKFLNRLKSIILLSDHVVSNTIATPLSYCILYNKPYFYIEQNFSHTMSRNDIPEPDWDELNLPYVQTIRNIFSKYENIITDKQRELISIHAGLNEVKSKNEIIELFQTAEDMYQQKTKHSVNLKNTQRANTDYTISEKNYFSVKTEKYPSNMKEKLLNLGCGQRHHPFWTNLDFTPGTPEIISHDLTKGIPFGAESFDAIYHSHLLEHFTKKYAPVFLKDCFRVLKPGAIIRVVVPDIETIIRLYLILLEKALKGDVDAQQRYEWIMLELFDQMVRNTSGGEMLEYWRQNPMPAEDFVIQRLGSEAKDAIAKIRTTPDANIQQSSKPDRPLDPHKTGQFRLSGEVHQWMYDRYSLGKLLQEAGFEDIRVCRADESSIPDFNSYLLDIEADGSVRKPDSLFMEARRPHAPMPKSKTTTTRINNDTAPQVAHFCMQDFGGAGTAALRLHLGLLSANFDSTFYVQNAHKWAKSTALLTASPNKERHGNKYSSPEWTAFIEQNGKLLSAYPNRPKDLEMFSTLWAAPNLGDNPALRHADIVHFHWIAGTVSIPANIDYLKNKKIVWTLHDMNPFTGGCHYASECDAYRRHCGSCPQLGSNQEYDLSFEIWKSKKTAYRELDITVITPSRWLGECAKTSSLFSTFPVHTIPYGLPTDIFNPSQRAETRARLNIGPDTFVVLFGADVLHNKRKGFSHILEMLKILKKSGHTNIILATFGRSKNVPLEDIGYPTISFDYVDSESKLAGIYSMADVTIIPSLEDNLPNIVLESMACGTPVVGFDVGGIPDMITHHYNGYLAKCGDSSDLANGAKWVRTHQSNNKILRTKCRETALLKYNMMLQSNAYIDVYNNIVHA